MTLRGLFVFALLLSCSLHAQDYFQQWVDYRIQVTLDDTRHELQGHIEMTYHNNSPDTLDEVYIHLWPNAYSSRSTALAEQLRDRGDFDLEFSEEKDRGSISNLAFHVDGAQVEYDYYQDQTDIAHIRLPEPLAPGAKMVISSPFLVKIPSSRFSRLGHIGESYQITQWYPKPAVYDKDGWHPMTYLTQGEFYSEFGSFDVSITLPENYVVGATGELQTESEVEFLKDKAVLSVQEPWKGKSNEFPPSASTQKTIRYTTENVHDFAWFADKRFHVIHERFSLDSGTEVDGWVLHTNRHAASWAKSMEYLVDGTKHYSRHVGDYPYSHVTVVDGTLAAGGGMEYPMITVINGTSNERSLERVVVHEIGHNWFYGILGSNERRDPWMDEGINSYYEGRYFREKYPDEDKSFMGMLGGGEGMSEMAYKLMACRHQDQSLDISSDEYSTINYGAMVYMKGALVMDHLETVLGTERYDEAMKSYFRDWAFKHPDEQAMQQSLEQATGESMEWFFQYLIRERAKVDHSLHDYDKKDNSIKVCSHGMYDGPVRVDFLKDSVIVDSQVGQGKEFRLSSQQKFTRAKIDADRPSIQLNRRNDLIRSRGLFKTWSAPRLQPLLGSGLDDRPGIYYAPALTWNEHDNWMLGGLLSNMELIPKSTEWTLLPLYSTSASKLVGMADIRQSIYPTESSSDRFEVRGHVRRFSLEDLDDLSYSYLKLSPSFHIIREDASKKKGRHEIFYKLHYIENRLEVEELVTKDELVFNQVGYRYEQGKGLTSWEGGLDLEFHDSYQKAELDLGIAQVYNKRKDQVSLRVYGAKMWTRGFIPLGARLALNGQGAGAQIDGTHDDYRYDNLLLGRGEQENLVSQQWVDNRGGFIQSTGYGFTDDWLFALNAEVDLPIPLPISVFGNYGQYATSADSENLYEVGARVKIIKDIFDVSLPMFGSQEISDFYEMNDIKYGETIRFQLRLDKLKFREIADRISI